MKRFTDKSEYSLEFLKDGICVTCPKCGNMGVVRMHGAYRTPEGRFFRFNCNSCNEVRTKSELEPHGYFAEALCSHCERFFRKDVPDSHRNFPAIKVNCPHCDTLVYAGVVAAKATKWLCWGGFRDGIEPNFGCSLYFLSSYDGKPVWAVNRAHLQYIISYIGADLRLRPRGLKGMSYKLPKFMKLAKNRGGVLKVLQRLLEK